jgi:hypothetical protein
MDGASKSKLLLHTARRDFPSFYLNGTAREKQVMDLLVLTTSMIVELRENAASSQASGETLAEMRQAAERTFIDLRGKLRACETFIGLPILEQRTIERVLFQRGPDES